MPRIDQLLKLHEADPTDADLPYMIAIEHGKQGDHEEALTWFDKAIATDPHHHYAYFQKAKSQSQLGEEDDAIATLDAGIAQAQQAGDGKALGELQELKLSMDMDY